MTLLHTTQRFLDRVHKRFRIMDLQYTPVYLHCLFCTDILSAVLL